MMYWAFAVAMETIVPCYLSLEHKHAPASNVIPFHMWESSEEKMEHTLHTHTHNSVCKNGVLFLWDSSACSIPVCKWAGERGGLQGRGDTQAFRDWRWICRLQNGVSMSQNNCFFQRDLCHLSLILQSR